jgi:hypothetical protein
MSLKGSPISSTRAYSGLPLKPEVSAQTQQTNRPSALNIISLSFFEQRGQVKM